MPTQKSASSEHELVFLPLGGSDEIGMNLNLFGYGPPEDRAWIMVDLGVTFGDERTPGIDLIMPDPEYILEYADNLVGLVLTHGHEDHIGAVAHLWPEIGCPIYATPFTAELVKGKFRDIGWIEEPPINVIPLGARFDLGPFNIELITLTHSIPEPNGLAIRTPAGMILHTGDWKIDPDPLIGECTDEVRLKELGDEGVRAMICDSTNVFSPGVAGSEADVRTHLLEVVKSVPNRVVITCFASNVTRVETVGRIALETGRDLCLIGRSMHRMVGAAKEVGLLKDFPPIVPEEEAGYVPRDKIVYLCTGSQGEQRAALARIASESHPHIALDPEDAVIFSSRVIPGNEVLIYELQNQLTERGVKVITAEDHFVHVSGHPCRDELAQMYQWVRPQIAVPVHGEARHLREHADLAKSLQIPEAVVPSNGTMVRLHPGPAEIIDECPNGRLYLDGNVLTTSDHLRERRKLSFAGLVNVALVMDEDGRLLASPMTKARGVPDLDQDEESWLAELEDWVEEAVGRVPKKIARDDEQVELAVRRTVRRFLSEAWGKRPLIDVSILRA